MTRARGASPPLVSITCVHTRAHRSLASPTSSSRGFSQPCTIVETLSSSWTIPDTHSHTRSLSLFLSFAYFSLPIFHPSFSSRFRKKERKNKSVFFFFFSLCSIFRVLSSFLSLTFNRVVCSFSFFSFSPSHSSFSLPCSLIVDLVIKCGFQQDFEIEKVRRGVFVLRLFDKRWGKFVNGFSNTAKK